MRHSDVKVAYSARGIVISDIDASLHQSHKAQLGDLAVFEVLSLGKHKKIQARDKTLRYIYPGDFILATFGPRYATNQFEGYIPDAPMDEYHILGQGGAIGILASAHSKFEGLGPTRLRMVGYAVDSRGEVINSRFNQNPLPPLNHFMPDHTAETILSIGSSMDSGKTTSAGYLAKGLSSAGNTVAYIKLTGTIYSKDADFVRDLGASLAIDFSYFGYPSTYLVDLPELLHLHQALLKTVQPLEPDYIIIEIADGLLQRETAALLTSDEFMSTIDHVLFSCGDSLGVAGGLSTMKQYGIQPFALSGLFTTSPLLIKEVEAYTSIPIMQLSDLMQADVCHLLTPPVLPNARVIPVDNKLIA